ncbi:MMPL family RND transporter, partial [Mycolicibacterium sphagni]|nr:MMPL family RND transporter [Mycolicibacterium sphagni]
MNRKYLMDRIDDMLVQADDMQTNIDTMDRMVELMTEMAATTSSMVGKTHTMVDNLVELRDHISDFEDFIRPIRNYLHWEPHCYNIPMCQSMRSVMEAIDATDVMTAQMEELLPDMDRLNELMPQMITLLPAQIDSMRNMRTTMLTMYQTQKGLQDQMAAQQ